jgi:thioredoxin reductase (NADPH)
MAVPTQSIIETRRHQMFPTLEPAEIERVRRFGTVRSYAVDEPLAKVGTVGQGFTIILAGKVEITQRDQSGRRVPIVTHGPGDFMGELAQLAGRPALVDAYAQEPVEALIIPPDRLRALLVSEAELGERIMRALILRRAGLLETGGGGDRRSCREWRCPSARRVSPPQRPPAANANPRPIRRRRR